MRIGCWAELIVLWLRRAECLAVPSENRGAPRPLWKEVYLRFGERVYSQHPLPGPEMWVKLLAIFPPLPVQIEELLLTSLRLIMGLKTASA